MIGKKSLVPIHPGTLFNGMRVDGELYYKHKNGYTLLCKDATVSALLFENFYAAGWQGQELFIEEQYLDSVLEASKHIVLPGTGREASEVMGLASKINLVNDYQDLKQRLSSLMEEVKSSGKVPLETYSLLTGEVSKKLELTDPALLIECINNMRDPDDYLNAHTANVGMLNGMIGVWLKLPPDDVDTLIKVGLFHDIGKLMVPVEVINKPGPLDDREYDEIKKHPIYAYEILTLSGETDRRVLEGVLSHHERTNGTGYPHGLALQEIPLLARITSVSDVYDAMVAKRVYKDRHSPFKILDEFAHNRFSNLDISIINVFLEKLPAVLLGKNVRLSDGRIAKVLFINPHDFAHPIVEADGNLLSTSPGLECIEMEDFLSLTPQV
jgi:HD-GYP domain-containing protein (c-di-GMP phosphodiesterase class II)